MYRKRIVREMNERFKKHKQIYHILDIDKCMNDIESVTFHITYVPNKSFFNCSKLNRVILNNVNHIGDFAFGICLELKEINIPPSVSVIGPHAFTFCGGLTQLTIPSTVYKIGPSAFQNCSNLKNLTIENGCKIIGNSAFKNCYALKSITIPKSVIKIGDSAFQMCQSMETLTILSDNLDLGANAFSYCSNLESVHLQGIRILKTGVFSQCKKLTSIVIPTDVIHIESSAFYNSLNLVYLDFEMYSLKKSFTVDSNLREIINVIGSRLNIDNMSVNYMITDFLTPEPIKVSNFCSTNEVFYNTEREIIFVD
jgi:hypothetical protein